MKKKMIKLFRKKTKRTIEENIEADRITHVANENVMNVDYVEDDRRNGDREWEEASKTADKSNEEVKIGSEERDECD
ncbi:hypothetical protein EWB00_003053 [Schistosoma japonicum]|uniref:Uncharacterized protein n=1 Tax=Schistosoma japonicum TaxID=6182 RepID=A0A4Z2D9Q2_SCHJA|nr:hypothetical protein EWB00_003053 [Schistosoma japonicum]